MYYRTHNTKTFLQTVKIMLGWQKKGCHTMKRYSSGPHNGMQVCVATVEAMYDLVLLEAMFTIIWERGKKLVFMFLQLATSFGL